MEELDKSKTRYSDKAREIFDNCFEPTDRRALLIIASFCEKGGAFASWCGDRSLFQSSKYRMQDDLDNAAEKFQKAKDFDKYLPIIQSFDPGKHIPNSKRADWEKKMKYVEDNLAALHNGEKTKNMFLHRVMVYGQVCASLDGYTWGKEFDYPCDEAYNILKDYVGETVTNKICAKAEKYEEQKTHAPNTNNFNEGRTQ